MTLPKQDCRLLDERVPNMLQLIGHAVPSLDVSAQTPQPAILASLNIAFLPARSAAREQDNSHLDKATAKNISYLCADIRMKFKPKPRPGSDH